MTQTIEQLTARVRELEEENARLQEEGNLPVRYYQPNGKGLVYAVYGSSSIDFVEELRAQLAAAQEEIANETAEACAKYVNLFLNGDGIQDEAWIRDIESGIRRGTWKEFKK